MIALGIESLTFDLLRPWIEEGKLPHFARVFRNGASSNLRSVIPWENCFSSWTSFSTGTNPGKHGVFDIFKKDGHDLNAVNSGDIKKEHIWQILSRHGKKVIVVNAPLSYPPEDVNGCLISGFSVPHPDSGYTYPGDLKDYLKSMGYKIGVDLKYGRRANLARSLRFSGKRNMRKLTKVFDDVEMKRQEAAVSLMGRHDWDFLFVLFESSDRLMHHYWAEDSMDIILRHFQTLDKMIGKFIEKMDPDTVLVIFSENGMHPIKKIIHINNILMDHGLLHVNKPTQRIGAILAVGRKIAGWSLRLGVPIHKLLLNESIFRAVSSMNIPDIDWGRTKAYFFNMTSCGIWVETERENYPALRNRIVNALDALKDPEDNKTVLKAFLREDVFDGPMVNSAPDIIITTKPGYRISPMVSDSREESRLRPLGPGDALAEHTQNGIFMIYGNGIKEGKVIDDVSVTDLAPTILDIMDVEVPKDMDGRVLDECKNVPVQDKRKRGPLKKNNLKVLLSSIPTRGTKLELLSSFTVAPLGMAYITSYARSRGYEVELVDANALGWTYNDLEEKIRKYAPDVIGTTLLTPSAKEGFNLFKLAKNINPDIITVAGGPHATVVPEDVLKRGPVDICVMGEGEETMYDILKSLEMGRDLGGVMGIAYRTNDGQVKVNGCRPWIDDLDTLPLPAWQDLPIDRYWEPLVSRKNFTRIFASRGCPYMCTFCSARNVQGRMIRRRSPANIVNEIRLLNTRYGVRDVCFNDSMLLSNEMNWLERICHVLIDSKLDIVWRANARADMINKNGLDILKLMKRSGLKCISLGVESGDDAILKKMRKGEDVRQMKEAVKLLRKAGIKIDASFMIGMPGETKETIENTIKLAKELDPDTAGFSIATPFPGTEFFNTAHDEGFMRDMDWDKLHFYSDKPAYHPQGLTPEYVRRMYSKANKMFYLRGPFLLRQMYKALSPVEVMAKMNIAMKLFKRLDWKRKKKKVF